MSSLPDRTDGVEGKGDWRGEDEGDDDQAGGKNDVACGRSRKCRAANLCNAACRLSKFR
jgi:hypothetical protein